MARIAEPGLIALAGGKPVSIVLASQ